MIFDFLKKQQKKEKKKKLLQVMLLNLHIPEEQKALYLEALDTISDEYMEQLFQNITYFVKDVEIKKLDDIHKSNFVEIAGMRKIEAEERKKELNSFSFLLHNL